MRRRRARAFLQPEVVTPRLTAALRKALKTDPKGLTRVPMLRRVMGV